MTRLAGVIVALATLNGCAMTVATRAPRYSVVEGTYDIPPGHMPAPGACRAWYPGRPPGHQPPSGDCDRLLRSTPSSAWVLYRPSEKRRVVRIG